MSWSVAVVPGVGEPAQLVEVAAFGRQLDEVADGVPVAVLGAATQSPQLGVGDDDVPPSVARSPQPTTVPRRRTAEGHDRGGAGSRQS